MESRIVNVGIIGCGAISPAYLENMKRFGILRVSALADIVPERAQARASEFGVPKSCSVADLLDDPEIEIVVNLTIPKAHYEVAMAAVRAGRSVWNEKPLATSRQEGKQLLSEAKRRNVLVGCAPDTFLGGGHQTCRKLIDDGWIGNPVAATAFMTSHGPEGWHPNPEFVYKVGAGPMFDMGPYYLTALINLIGPISRVTGSARITFPERTIMSEPKRGTRMTVEVPTHIAGVMDFANGAVGTIVTSFDVWAAQLPRIEVYGAEGSLSVPDPNGPGGPVKVRRRGGSEWTAVPLSHPYADVSRAIGVADMAYALRSGRPHRATGELAYHVLDVMHAFHDASASERHVRLESTCRRPAPLPLGLRDGVLDE